VNGVIHVVDYGIGNLHSVARAIEKIGGTPRLITHADEVAGADRLILPGVGAFRDGMAGIRRGELADAIVHFAGSGRPLLGICLGMQMLATSSSEYGEHKGLGIIPGHVEAIQPISASGGPRKVPFVGWAELEPTRPDGFAGTILGSISAADSIYLVHSYQFIPDDPADLLAIYRYDGAPISAVVKRGNVIGCQFHPEKSAQVGLRLMERFLKV
jgi:glutamine amidotransferase